MPTKEQIQQRAYELWERDGRPEGRAMSYWLLAEQDLGAGSVDVHAGEPSVSREGAGEPANDPLPHPGPAPQAGAAVPSQETAKPRKPRKTGSGPAAQKVSPPAEAKPSAPRKAAAKKAAPKPASRRDPKP